jgi:hypothetical protein
MCFRTWLDAIKMEVEMHSAFAPEVLLAAAAYLLLRVMRPAEHSGSDLWDKVAIC